MKTDVLVTGAGQSGLAAGYYLRRVGLSSVLLDAQAGPGATAEIRYGCSRPPKPAPYKAGCSPAPWTLVDFPARDAVVG